MKPLVGMTASVIALLATSTCQSDESFDSDGTNIGYSVAGTGEPVVLVHGFLGSREEWTAPPPFLPPGQRDKFQTAFAALSKEYRVIALDCRGHGRSGKPHDAKQYGLAMVEDIVRLLDHLQVDKAHIVGYSMGAFISAKLVEAHPDRVRSVVLGGGGALLEGSEQLAFMVSLGKSLESGKGVAPLILAMTPPGQPKPTAKQIEQNNRLFLANQDERALAQVALGHKRLTVSKAKLQSNQVPVLLIVGENDPLKASSQTTNELTARSKLVVLKGLDHISAELSPKFLSNIQDFLKEN